MGERPELAKFSFILSLLIGLAVIAISIYGFSLLRFRPGLPKDIEGLWESKSLQVIRIDNFDVREKRDLEFVLRNKKIGDPADFYLKFGGAIEKRTALLVSFYGPAGFPLVYFAIGLCCLIIGIGVFWQRPEDLKARIFYWTMLAFAPAVIISGDNYCLRREWTTFIPCLLFILGYASAPAWMMDFSMAFSRRPSRGKRFLIFVPALIFVGLQGSTFLYAFLKPSYPVFRFSHSIYFIFLIYVISYVLVSILNFGLSYRRAELEEEKAQIQWIFYGLIVGLSPFIFLYQIPQTLGLKPLMSEEITTVFFIAIPVVVAISVVRYKLMNIVLVINRSLVYSLLTIFIVSLYLLFIQFSQKLFAKFFLVHGMAVSAIGVFLAALAFQPALKKIQEFVDKAFFRQRYDYRLTVLKFSESAQRLISQNELLDYFLREINRAIPVESLSVLIGPESVKDQEKERILKIGSETSFQPSQILNLESAEITARRGGVQTAEHIDFSHEAALEKYKLEMVMPVAFPTGGRKGFLLFGKKRSGFRYAREDIELIKTMANELTLNLDRLRLQEEVIYERASIEKLDELNRLKTEFISTVSHELRTPMSSIQGLAEILQSGKIKDKEKREQFLNLMASESGRLSRFLHNVLDFGRIEQGMKTYHFQKTDVVALIRDVVAIFQQALDSQGFGLSLQLPNAPRVLDIDGDAVKQALINLMDNAIKYSAAIKHIEIALQDGERDLEIRIRDQGIGIPMEDQEKIFDKFYRVAQAERLSPKGAGLGLKIVRHIMAAHHGLVRVQSEAGRGSAFSLIFPKR